MKTRFIILFSLVFSAQNVNAQSDPIQAIQAAQMHSLKEQIKTLSESIQGLQQGQKESQQKIASLSTELSTLKTSVATAQTTANSGVTAASTAQSTADRALREAAAAQSTANLAYAKTFNSVLMVGAETGRPWATCPEGYRWIGGFNNDTTVAYPEMNRWHSHYSWLCVRN